MLELSTTCRSCMKYDEKLEDLFVTRNDDNGCSLQLAELLMTTASIKVSKEDGLPQQMCNKCAGFLQSVHNFRKNVLSVDFELKKLFLGQPDVKDEIDLKCEGNTDYLDNYDVYIMSDDVVPKEEAREIDLKQEDQELDVCKICQKPCTNHSCYLKHLSSHLEPKFFCSGCKKSFRKESSLTKHIDRKCKNATLLFDATDLSVKTERDEEGMFKCTLCPVTFSKHRSLTSHLKKHKRKHDSCNIYRCDDCSKEFTMKSALKRHMKLHATDKAYQCSICSKKYSRRDQLEDHLRKHTGLKPHPCPHCNKGFTQLCSLKDHIRTHTKETPFLCPQCGKGFGNSSNLRQHLLRHTGNKSFACNLCPKTFYTKGQLKAHGATHTGGLRYQCPDCSSALTTPSSLKKHRLIHLDVRPYACDTCNYRFTCKDHLKRHQRTHTGEKPYRCAHCERVFTQSNDLIKHLRSHVGQNVYQCSICEMKFRLLCELRRHYPVHYINGSNASQVDAGDPSVLLMEAQAHNSDKPEDQATAVNKHLDNQITITFNSNVLDKNMAGDITINISPTKS